MQRRLPKFGFITQKALAHREVRLSDLERLKVDIIDFAVLQAEGFISSNIKTVKIFLDAEIKKALTIQGLAMTAGAKKAIEAVGGKVL